MRSIFPHHRWFALAARTVIGQAGLVSLGSDSNRRPAAGTWAPATAVDRVALARNRRDEGGAHQAAGGQVKLAKPRVIELGGRHPGVQPERPERLTLIDVADTGADPLLEQQLSEGGRLRPARALDDGIQIEGIDQDIRPEVGYGCLGIANQLHDWRGEADRNHVIEAEHRGGPPFRLAPALARPIHMPRPGHPHVRVERDPALEPHEEMLAVRLDGFHPSTLESGDRYRAGIIDDLARDAPPQCGGRAPDRVAFRQGRAGAPARGRRLSAWCRTRLRAASLPAATP